jgi:ATP-dependent 26S proteasome regulatory subunit
LTSIIGAATLVQETPADKTYYKEYVDDATYVRMYYSEGKHPSVQVRGATANEDIFKRIQKLSLNTIKTKKDSNSIFALMASKNGLTLRAIGKMESNLIEENYNEASIKGYKHIIECLESDDPCGRLILLQGPPGTGKSYMIRSLVSSVNSTFIVVGAHMIADLSGPAILPVILGCIDPDDTKPITFILEDSDIALSDRKNGGVAELSGLLNLGDGLLGEMLDIRILATTNAELLDLDPAVTRPGRMCQHIKLDPLDAKEATTRLAQMVGDEKRTIKKATTLAEIYRMARKDGWEPKGEEKKKTEGQYL